MEMEERVEQLEQLLGAELTHVLRAATDALERVAPVQFEAIGTRSLDLDGLMINAQAAAALPELMARFCVVASTRRAQSEPYAGRDWAADAAAEAAPVKVPAGARERFLAEMREIPQDRFGRRVA